MLLAFSSRHEDGPAPPLGGDVEAPAIRARPASASSEPLPPRALSFIANGGEVIKAAVSAVVCSLLGQCGQPPSTWQCNAQDGSVTQDGVTVDASIPCNWGLAATPSTSCAGAELLAAIEKKERR